MLDVSTKKQKQLCMNKHIQDMSDGKNGTSWNNKSENHSATRLLAKLGGENPCGEVM